MHEIIWPIMEDHMKQDSRVANGLGCEEVVSFMERLCSLIRCLV